MAPFKAGDSCYIELSGKTKYAGTVARLVAGTKTTDDPEYYEVDVRQEWGKDDKGVEGWLGVKTQRMEYDAKHVKKTPAPNVARFTG